MHLIKYGQQKNCFYFYLRGKQLKEVWYMESKGINYGRQNDVHPFCRSQLVIETFGQLT